MACTSQVSASTSVNKKQFSISLSLHLKALIEETEVRGNRLSVQKCYLKRVRASQISFLGCVRFLKIHIHIVYFTQHPFSVLRIMHRAMEMSNRN
jgi:hypothetical protein